MDNAIYIVFSATPTHMGRFIRLTTRNRYNHVSLSFEEDLNKLYSFARHHRTIPLYGGFVVESILRYRSFAGQAQVKICRLPVAEPHFTYLHNYLERLWKDREEYIYNTPAAVASIIRRYPNTFAVMSSVSEVMGNFKHLDNEGKVQNKILDSGDSPAV